VPAVRPAVEPSARILDAADRLLARFGYRKMTVEDIAAEAGMGKGTVYLSFVSKEEVALSCIDRMVEQLLAELRRIASGPGSRRERLRAMLALRVMRRLDYASGHATSLDALLSAVRPALLARRERHFAAEARIFAEVVADAGRIRAAGEPAAERVAGALVTATNALLPYSLSATELGRRVDIERRVHELADLLLKGLEIPGNAEGPSRRSTTHSRRLR
jgi:AcrR family transcriptional regulator